MSQELKTLVMDSIASPAGGRSQEARGLWNTSHSGWITSILLIYEARALSPSEKQKLRQALDRELGPVGHTDLDSREETFVNRLRQKGLIADMPLRLPDDELRRNYKRI